MQRGKRISRASDDPEIPEAIRLPLEILSPRMPRVAQAERPANRKRNSRAV